MGSLGPRAVQAPSATVVWLEGHTQDWGQCPLTGEAGGDVSEKLKAL
jgi:hypothetical protein